MKTVDKEKIVKIPSIIDREYSFKEICDMLDYEEQRYLSWEWKNYTTLEVLNSIKNRKNTFLTSK